MDYPPYVKHETANELGVKYADQIKGKTSMFWDICLAPLLITGLTIALVVITGASPNGLGAAITEAIAKSSPEAIILAGPSETRLSATVSAVRSSAGTAAASTKFHLVELDLSSQKSVRKAAEAINALTNRIDVLFLNSGVMAMPYGLSVEGVEQHFAINHLGHFLLTNLLLDKVIAAAATNGGQARIVVSSSDAHFMSPVVFENLPNYGNGESYSKWPAFAASKSANALFAFDLAGRIKSKGVQVFSLQPGFVVTGEVVDGKPQGGIGRHMLDEDYQFMGMVIEKDRIVTDDKKGKPKTAQEGAATSILAAFDPSIGDKSGAYLRDMTVATENVAPWCSDVDAGKKLWTVSEDLVGEKFSI